MVRIRTLCQGAETLLLALESMTFPPESPEIESEGHLPDSPGEAEWATLWPSRRSLNGAGGS